MIKKLKSEKISVSLFLDPNPNDIRKAHHIGADAVELCTKTYSELATRKQRFSELQKPFLNEIAIALWYSALLSE